MTEIFTHPRFPRVTNDIYMPNSHDQKLVRVECNLDDVVQATHRETGDGWRIVQILPTGPVVVVGEHGPAMKTDVYRYAVLVEMRTP